DRDPGPGRLKESERQEAESTDQTSTRDRRNRSELGDQAGRDRKRQEDCKRRSRPCQPDHPARLIPHLQGQRGKRKAYAERNSGAERPEPTHRVFEQSLALVTPVFGGIRHVPRRPFMSTTLE